MRTIPHSIRQIQNLTRPKARDKRKNPQVPMCLHTKATVYAGETGEGTVSVTEFWKLGVVAFGVSLGWLAQTPASSSPISGNLWSQTPLSSRESQTASRLLSLLSLQFNHRSMFTDDDGKEPDLEGSIVWAIIYYAVPNCDTVSRQRDQRDHNLLGFTIAALPKSRRACHYVASRLVRGVCDTRVSVWYVL